MNEFTFWLTTWWLMNTSIFANNISIVPLCAWKKEVSILLNYLAEKIASLSLPDNVKLESNKFRTPIIKMYSCKTKMKSIDECEFTSTCCWPIMETTNCWLIGLLFAVIFWIYFRTSTRRNGLIRVNNLAWIRFSFDFLLFEKLK